MVALPLSAGSAIIARVQQSLMTKQIEDHVVLVTLNRPQALNSIDPQLALDLEQTVIEVENDDRIFVAIITGAGERAFCAGADLKVVAQGRLSETFTPAGGFGGFVNASRAKPWIAAVNGFAVAGGLEIVLACDLAVTSSSAQFGLPEVKRGLIASAGGLYRLPRALPKAIAMELIATGDLIDASRAFDLGLVNKVVEPSSVIPEALTLANRICANAPLAVRESIAIARAAAHFDDPELKDKGDEAQQRLSKTADYREGASAFIEKRPPRWRGS
jgi:enoyl-CoA hydratase/carnithine racemase